MNSDNYLNNEKIKRKTKEVRPEMYVIHYPKQNCLLILNAAKDSDDEDFNPYERGAGRLKKVKIDEATAGDPGAPAAQPGDFKIKRKSKNSNSEGEKQGLDKQSLEQVLKTIKYSFEKPNIAKVSLPCAETLLINVLGSYLRTLLRAPMMKVLWGC